MPLSNPADNSSGTSASAVRYRWWPRYSPGTVELGGAGPSELIRTVSALLFVDVVLALPPVARTIGLRSRTLLLLGILYALCMVFNDLVLHPRAMKSRRWFNAQLAIVPIYNVLCCASFIVLPNEPRTPLWLNLFAYAGFTGIWQEIDRSIAYLLLHTLFPLLTIPIFLWRGADPGWSVAGPVICSLFCGLFYNGMAANTATWRRVRMEQAATIAELRRQAAETERTRLARDLHDSVGSVLGLVSIYGDLIERHATNPAELVEIARTLREAAQEGLGDLRGVLDALSPEATDFASLGRALRRLAGRLGAGGGISVDVQVTGELVRPLEGPERLGIVRVFQEALNNAIRHGHAHAIQVQLAATGQSIALEIRDDGAGFSREVISEGRGLPGMRTRAMELGGSLEVVSTPGQGTHVRMRLPLRVQNGGVAA